MTAKQDTVQIQVPESVAPIQLAAAARGFLIALGGYLAGKGWIDASLYAASVPLIMVAGPIIWGQLVARKRHAEAVVMADKLDNDDAVVVKK